MTIVIRIPLAPVPASRPRVSRWGTYYAKTYKNWMAAAEKLVNASAKPPLTCALHVKTEVIAERPKTTKRLWPRGDSDNYEKAAWDLITKKGYWLDDDQIVENRTIKRFALPGEQPCTIVTINPL